MAGIIAIVICILVLAKEGRHSAYWVFTHFEPLAGWPAGWSFCVGLLQASWATSATGMIISYDFQLSLSGFAHRTDTTL